MRCPDCDDDVEMDKKEVECLLGYGAKDLGDSVMVTIYTCPSCKHEEAEEDNDDGERWEE